MAALKSALLLLLLLLLCCTNPAPPRTGLRFAVTDAQRWTQEADGRWSCSLLGARCAVDLGAPDARIELAVENATAGPIELRVGPQATRSATAAIGELRVLPLGRMPVEGVPDYEPYVALDPVALKDGARATFYLDTPLGREPSVGQYLVLVIEARDGRDGFDRRLLSLVATNADAVAAPRQ